MPGRFPQLARDGTRNADLVMGDSACESDRAELTSHPELLKPGGPDPLVDDVTAEFDPKDRHVAHCPEDRIPSNPDTLTAASPPLGWPVIVCPMAPTAFLAIPFLGWLALLPIVRSAGSSEASGWRDLAVELAGQLGLGRVRFLRSDCRGPRP